LGTKSLSKKSKKTMTTATKTKKPAAKTTIAKTKNPAVKKAIEPAELTDKFGRSYTIEYIPLEVIDSHGSRSQIPARYDGAAVEEYARLMASDQWDWERAESFPVLFREVVELFDEDDTSLGLKTDYWIGDGHHTIDAADDGTRESIRCRVYLGDLTDAKSYSFREANRYHGVRLNSQQKRDIVIETLTDREMLRRIVEPIPGSLPGDIPSDRLIAHYLNDVVSTATIAGIWDSLIESDITDNMYPWLSSATKRLGQDGKRQKVKAKAKPEPVIEPIAAIEEEPTIAPVEIAESIVPGNNLEPIENTNEIPIDNQSEPIELIAETIVSENNLKPATEPDEGPIEEFDCPSLPNATIAEIGQQFGQTIADSLSELYSGPELVDLSNLLAKSIAKTIRDHRDGDF
jgi:hypothetical protein